MNSLFVQEQKRLNLVLETIRKELNTLEEETNKRKNEVVATRKHFWDEIKVNTDTFDDYLETIIGLRQEAQALSVSQSQHRYASERMDTLHRMKKSPYFGRIDFKEEEGEVRQEQIYIGISSLTETNGDDFLVYDWRAPISSIYYDHQPGPVQYTTPEGTIIYGDLQKKWQYLIRDGALQSMFDTSLTIGDEILQQVLGKGTNKQLHSIVATIQQEQNQIIRHDHGRLLIVHGAAGSGKTSAALQRIAYLLYKYREQLNAEQIILFSPNSMFSSYVSHVLPELGEENMQQVTFQEYLLHRLRKMFQVENAYDQLEYVLTTTDSPAYRARVDGISFKASIRFLEAIQTYRKSLESSGMLFKHIRFRGETIATAQEIADRFYNHDTSLRFYNRLEKLRDWLMDKIKEKQRTEQTKSWVQDEVELLSDQDYHEARRYLAEKRGLAREAVDAYEVKPEEIAKLIVHQKIKPLRKRIQALQFIHITGLYKQLFVNPVQLEAWLEGITLREWTAICQMTIEKLDDNQLFYEDATPFLFLKECIQGFQTNNLIKHIVVDEAQDYTPFQFEFLKRLFPVANMTILGDFNQAIFAHANESVNFNTLTQLYGSDKTDIINITRSYRSTKPIIEFTRKLVPNGDKIIPFERSGETPILTYVADKITLHKRIADKVDDWKGQGYHSIALICKSDEESRQAHKVLSSIIDDIKWIQDGATEYEQGVVIIPSYLSKGIEFDAVIVYNASAEVYGDESLRRLFYTVCTRAMHSLQLYTVGKPSPFLQIALQEGLLQ
ncbi:RNA polymerase recycling motor HelD [Gracilibacillus phocaeensis]|uniref:RNA polymerase recycling motor HelD n=1 Tax=Gracilibacillus phocaeensis TaxID=2042304 RepID=UPI0010321093|nr:RNA polymerase recycling motor HelD [Gracilibacillus phocaeensis]